MKRFARPPAVLTLLALGVFAGCSADRAPTATADTEPESPPATVAIAPGECRPPLELAEIAIRSGGASFAPTLGVGSSDCAGATGEGYLVRSYEPAVIDAANTFTVEVDGEVDTELSWSGPQVLTRADTTWSSPRLPTGCNRLEIKVTSLDGSSTATYGADIRVGGVNVPCPIRDAPDPIDPADIVPIDTSVEQTEISLVLPTIGEPPTIITEP